jgi:hypothetical protein
MQKSVWRRPSPALVVSFIALLVALGGTAYAGLSLPKNSVGTKQLKNNAVTSKKLASGAVTARNMSVGAVTTATLENGAVSSGQIAFNAIGFTQLDTTGNVTVTTFPAGTEGSVVASCPAGFTPLTGFGGWNVASPGAVLQFSERNGNGWMIGGFNGASTPSTLQVDVVCLRSPATTS